MKPLTDDFRDLEDYFTQAEAIGYYDTLWDKMESQHRMILLMIIADLERP